MTMVGIRELKSHLSRYLRRVKNGESLAITEHGRAVATLVPSRENDKNSHIWKLVADGRLQWSGGKPIGLKARVPSRGRKASDMVIEDRADRAR